MIKGSRKFEEIACACTAERSPEAKPDRMAACAYCPKRLPYTLIAKFWLSYAREEL